MAENFVTKGSGAIEVPFSDDQSDESVRDEDLLFEADKPGETPEQKAARNERRRERQRAREQERKDALAANEQLRRESAELKERLARLEGAVVASRQPAPGADPFKARLEALEEKRKQAYAAVQAELKAGALTAERQAYYERVGQEVDEERIRIHTERVLAEREPVQRQVRAKEVWEHKYPDVYGNPAAYDYAEGTFKRRRALGEEITAEKVDEILTEARTVFKTGPKPASALRTDRERLSGTPSSGSGGGDNRASGGIAMTRELRAMAEAKYSDLPQQEAWKKWADNEGKELRKQKVL